MKFTLEDMDILNKLVGNLTGDTAARMNRNLECFLHPAVSLFIPACGQCSYAITPNHTHPAYTFIYYFQPVNDFIVEGRHLAYDLSDGMCLSAMSPQIPHQEIEEDHFQSYIAIAIDAELFEKTAIKYINAVPVFKGEAFVPHPELLNLLRCFMLEYTETRYKNNELLGNLAEIITNLVIRSIITDTYNKVPLYDRFEIDRAIAYMNNHFSEKITTEDLAEWVNLSTGHFTKVFKSITGDTPIDFLNMLRLQRARNMLMNKTVNITQVALNCGFGSPSYFSTCFLEKYNMTPSAYRQNIVKVTENREY